MADGASSPAVWLGLPHIADITPPRPTEQRNNGTRSEELVDEIASFGLHDVSAEAWFLALLGVMAFRRCTIRCVLR